VAANGFVLGQYQRHEPAQHSLELKTLIEYSYDKKATLTAKKDLATVYAKRDNLALQLIAGSLFVGTAFWFLIDTVIRRRREAAVLKARTEELFEEKQLVEITLHSIGDAVITTDPLGKITYMNPVAEQLTGWSQSEARNRPLPDVFHIIEEATRKPAANPVARCLEEGSMVSLANGVVLISRHGNEYAIEDTSAPIRHTDGRVVGAVLVFKDATEKKRLVRQISHQARHDSLTGLANRSEFNRQLERLLRDVRSGDGEHALCYLDLDQFKVVNDTCGHIAGDALLQQISMLLKEHARAGDIVARLGGDEFGLLLENCPLAKADEISRTLCRTIGELRFSWEDKVFEVGVSIGLVPVTTASEGPTQLLSQADVACYMAKDLGRNRIHVYTVEDKDLSRRERELHWASLISGALEQDRFRLYVQPILSLDSSKATTWNHYEVLLRMLDDDDSEILPGVFIPAAERYNLMPSLDRWVIQNTLAYYDKQRRLLEAGETTLSINLSGNSINEEGLQTYIEEQLTQFNVPPQAICFEITETAVIHNLSRASEFIRSMKKLGCRFALDDFGSGLSSFAYLKTLPVDYLKIDGEFVRDMMNDRIDDAMVASINNIGHVMGIKTIAEFVENSAILDRLRELGVDYAQGYGIAIPEPIERMIPAGHRDSPAR
jgi:diguanylate cyclase (GGDEF)-like protein/PAS domain S-box-containing protein